LQQILEDDSSDNSSLLSNTSDEGSCSTTDSTRDSTSTTDDISDYISGDSLRNCNSPWRNSPDPDISSSPSYAGQSSLGVSCTPRSPETTGGTDFADGECFRRTQRDDGLFLRSDSTKQCRKLANSSSRETDSSRLGWFNDVKSGINYRKPTRERTY
jgi:hypothetical protein